MKRLLAWWRNRPEPEPDFVLTSAEGTDIAPIGCTQEELDASLAAVLAGLRREVDAAREPEPTPAAPEGQVERARAEALLPPWSMARSAVPEGQVEALAQVIAAEVWRIHGPQSTDQESADMDGDDIARTVLAAIAAGRVPGVRVVGDGEVVVSREDVRIAASEAEGEYGDHVPSSHRAVYAACDRLRSALGDRA